ncbi:MULTISPECIES: DUF4809 family protein [Vagococcus]|uniref:DUF4809 domain-containing protein n=1 Tax=Vagococcus fluvialis bH819 TaxID=1255619 RepID=A0A1X6WSI3_9ENTE|nr:MULTISPECIES: DUF4809 family protein [Vagococcus]SLM87245.1 hypothetical protein FM121_14185 [Vagococcus fluvialis bH819]
MKEVKIIKTTDLINGGCNACPTVKSDVYVLVLNDLNRPLENLDVTSLVMTVALANGYKQYQEYDMAEDYDVYKNGTNEVSVIPEYDKLIIKKGFSQHKVANNYQEPAEIFAVVNNILTQFFDLEGLNFVIEEEK